MRCREFPERVIFNRGGRLCLPVHLGFAPADLKARGGHKLSGSAFLERLLAATADGRQGDDH